MWSSASSSFVNIVAGAQANLLLMSNAVFPGINAKGSTITRLIVDLRVKAASVAQLNEVFWGIVMVNGDASAAGAFPEADVLGDRAGWMVRGRFMVIQDSLSDRSQWDEAKLDLRAQRIMRNEEDELHLILDNSGGFTAQWAAFIRVLVKNPP